MTRLRHYDNLGTVRFVTFSCYRRYRVFDVPHAPSMLVAQLETLRSQQGVRLLGYVIMPEHVHLVLWPPDDCKLGIVIGQFKARSARDILAAWPGSMPDELTPETGSREHHVFQRRCYDHNCRTVTTVKEKIEYCHKNPVTRELVRSPEEWEWSSYKWYQGRRDVPLAMDEVEL